MIADKEYRYISPALDWNARDKSSGAPQGCTLTSVALTNRPFLEAMPEVHLSDSGFVRAIGIEESHVLGPLKTVSVANQQPSYAAGASEGKGGNVAIRLTIKKLTDGDHAGHHGIFDGDDMKGYVTDGDFQKHSARFCNCDHADRASEIGASAVRTFTEAIGAKGKTQEEVRELVAAGSKLSPADLFTETTTEGVFDRRKAARLTDRGKLTHEQFIQIDEVGQAVDQAVCAGKVLPALRGAAMKLALSDRAAFDELMKAAKPIVDMEVRGGTEGRPSTAGTASEEIEELVAVYLSEHKLERARHYRDALQTVTEKNPELWKRACREGRAAVQS
jgi:Mu-like prophage I protein